MVIRMEINDAQWGLKVDYGANDDFGPLYRNAQRSTAPSVPFVIHYSHSKAVPGQNRGPIPPPLAFMVAGNLCLKSKARLDTCGASLMPSNRCQSS